MHNWFYANLRNSNRYYFINMTNSCHSSKLVLLGISQLTSPPIFNTRIPIFLRSVVISKSSNNISHNSIITSRFGEIPACAKSLRAFRTRLSF